MDRTEISVRHMLTAIEAPLYAVGVLSHRGMRPGLDGIPAAAVLVRLSVLKNRNARGSHIYIRPTGEHRYTALDDLSETSLAKLTADGFTPCAVVETSRGNFQAWLRHSVVFPKLLSTFAAQTLAARYDADPSAADWRRFGRLPGFTNCKPKYKRPDGLFPFVHLKSHSASNIQWRRTSRAKSPSCTTNKNRSGRRNAYVLLLFPRGDRGCRMCLWNAFGLPNPIHALAAARSDRPSMLISDVAMPQMSGIDLAISMSVLFPELKIVLFSGQANTYDLLEAARVRGYDFHLGPKPLHPTVLLSYIRALLPANSE